MQPIKLIVILEPVSFYETLADHGTSQSSARAHTESMDDVPNDLRMEHTMFTESRSSSPDDCECVSTYIALFVSKILQDVIEDPFSMNVPFCVLWIFLRSAVPSDGVSARGCEPVLDPPNPPLLTEMSGSRNVVLIL